VTFWRKRQEIEKGEKKRSRGRRGETYRIKEEKVTQA